MPADFQLFWSTDYITGISALLGYIDQDIDRLKKELRFYEKFIDECCSPFLKRLGELSLDTSLIEHEGLVVLLKNWQSQLGVEELRSQGLVRLKKASDDSIQLRSTLEKETKSVYSIYSQNLRSTQSLVKLYDRKSALPLKNDQGAVKFPIELDSELKFANELELSTFIQNIKGSMPEAGGKLLNFMGGSDDKSFKGRQLLDTIKKHNSKLDTSLFNMDKLGQNLIAHRIIKPSAIIGSGDNKFDLEWTYYWNDHQETNGLSIWLQSLTSKQETIDNYELDSMVTSMSEKFYQLEYSKFELEKKIYESAKKTFLQHQSNLDLLVDVGTAFNATFKQTADVETTGPQEIDRMIKNGVIGYFTRDNCLPYHIRIRSERQIVYRTFMFGIETIDEDTANTVERILEHINAIKGKDDVVQKQIENCWISGDIRDMKRSINLKTELMNAFSQSGSNLASVDSVIDGNKYNSVVNDWIWLLKMWLLELQDGLIVTKCCQRVAGGDQWLHELPTKNLGLLVALRNHLQDTEVQKFEIPLSHYLTRRDASLHSREHLDSSIIKLFDPANAELVCDLNGIHRQQERARSQTTTQSRDEIPRDTTSEAAPFLRPATPPATLPLPAVSPIGSFVPKPFKTTSTG